MAYVSEDGFVAGGFLAGAAGAIGAAVFGFFALEVDEDFVVCEEGGLGVDDLGWMLMGVFGGDGMEMRRVFEDSES